jgi:hypothetical protein
MLYRRLAAVRCPPYRLWRTFLLWLMTSLEPSPAIVEEIPSDSTGWGLRQPHDDRCCHIPPRSAGNGRGT